MGKLDRRRSLKMRRRKAQAKKKSREKAKKVNRKVEAAPAPKKTRGSKASQI